MLTMTLLAAVKHYLLLPGEALTAAEYKKLTDKDKTDLAVEFEKIGVEIIPAK